jgi:predicted nucleic acid-binding protein
VIVVDASVWVSRFVAGDVNHVASREWLEAYLGRGRLAYAPMVLLAEIGGAVSRRSGDPTFAGGVVQALRELPQLRLMPVDRGLGVSAARLATDLGLRGTDATYVAVAQLLHVPLLTLDRDQHTRGGRVITTHTPASIDPRTV